LQLGAFSLVVLLITAIRSRVGRVARRLLLLLLREELKESVSGDGSCESHCAVPHITRVRHVHPPPVVTLVLS
jgi:hypothetical protein